MVQKSQDKQEAVEEEFVVQESEDKQVAVDDKIVKDSQDEQEAVEEVQLQVSQKFPVADSLLDVSVPLAPGG